MADAFGLDRSPRMPRGRRQPGVRCAGGRGEHRANRAGHAGGDRGAFGAAGPDIQDRQLIVHQHRSVGVRARTGHNDGVGFFGRTVGGRVEFERAADTELGNAGLGGPRLDRTGLGP